MDMVDNSILKLLKRGVTLQEFTLDMILLYRCGSRIDRWLELATEMNVKELILLFEGNENEATVYCPHHNHSMVPELKECVTKFGVNNVVFRVADFSSKFRRSEKYFDSSTMSCEAFEAIGTIIAGRSSQFRCSCGWPTLELLS